MFKRHIKPGPVLLGLILAFLALSLLVWKLISPTEIQRAAAMPQPQSTDNTLDWETAYPLDDDQSILDETLNADDSDNTDTENDVTPIPIKTITPRPGASSLTPTGATATEETPTITNTPPPDEYRTEDAEMGSALVTQPPQMVLPAKRSEIKASPVPTKSPKDVGVFGYFNWRLFVVGLAITIGFGLVAVLGAQLILARSKRS